MRHSSVAKPAHQQLGREKNTCSTSATACCLGLQDKGEMTLKSKAQMLLGSISKSNSMRIHRSGGHEFTRFAVACTASKETTSANTVCKPSEMGRDRHWHVKLITANIAGTRVACRVARKLYVVDASKRCKKDQVGPNDASKTPRPVRRKGNIPRKQVQHSLN